MSNQRISKGAGWVDTGKRRPGAICRCGCGQAVPRGRRTFANEACVDQWKIRTQPGYVRLKVWERDHGICALCGADTNKLLEAAKARWMEAKPHYWWQRPKGTFWHADHIVPVVEGGGECGLDKYRTLCLECHRKETAALRKRLAAERRQQQLQQQGQAQLALMEE